MTDETFEQHEIGLINKRLEKMKNSNSETFRFWAHITGVTFDFEQGVFTFQSMYPAPSIHVVVHRLTQADNFK
jgi:hypothetical protein